MTYDPANGWDEETLAYAAGFLDGEGCFAVGRHWKITVSCANTNRAVIEWFKATFGGTVSRSSRRRKANHRICWQWCVVSRGADRVCKWVAPYLKEKAPQALLLISLQQTMGLPGLKKRGSPVDPEVAAERDRLAALVKGLKRLEL